MRKRHTETEFIVWEKRLELDLPFIDSQHRKIISLVNALHKEILKHRTSSLHTSEYKLKTMIDATIEYTKEHFATEEKLMILSDYKDREDHKNKHTLFMKEIGKMVEHFEFAPMSYAHKILKFVYDWIFEHILYDDKILVEHLKAFLKKTGKKTGKK